MTRFHETTWPAEEASFREVILRHEPTVFRGLAAHWGLSQFSSDASTLDWVTSLVGHRTVPLHLSLVQDCGLLTAKGSNAQSTLSGQRLLSEVTNEMKRELERPTGHALYVQAVEVQKHLPELLPILQLPLDNVPATGHWRFWMGIGDNHVTLHSDVTENVFCLLYGEKEFTLFPPDVVTSVYPQTFTGGPYGTPISCVDPRQPDLKKYPRFEEALSRSISIKLSSADVLYLPAHWWHHVRSLGLHVSVNYWWTDLRKQEELAATAAFLKALLSMPTLPRHWRCFWQSAFEMFVFRLEDEPFSYLPAEQRDFVAAATPEHLETIRSRLRDYERQSSSYTLSNAEILDAVYQISPSLELRLVSNDKIAVRSSPSRGYERQIPLAMITVISQFCSPRMVHEVLSILQAQMPDLDVSEFLGFIRDLVLGGVLMRSENRGSS